MSIVDPISDMLTRIRNAYAVGKESVVVSDSKVKRTILSIFAENGYIEGFEVEGKNLSIELKYSEEGPVVESIERVSKPGRRMYVKKDEIRSVLSGRGIAVVSTSKGMMTGDDARKANLGGEFICKVY